MTYSRQKRASRKEEETKHGLGSNVGQAASGRALALFQQSINRKYMHFFVRLLSNEEKDINQALFDAHLRSA